MVGLKEKAPDPVLGEPGVESRCWRAISVRPMERHDFCKTDGTALLVQIVFACDGTGQRTSAARKGATFCRKLGYGRSVSFT